MKKKIATNSLYWSLLRITIIPIVFLSVVITTFSAKSFAASMHKEVENGLQDLCNTILTIYDTTYDNEKLGR